MKRLSVVLAIALTSFVSTTAAQETEQETAQGSLPAPLQLPIDVAYTYFPTSDMADYRMMGAEVGGGADLTCSGVTIQGSMESMIANFTAISGQLASNAPGIAINYLIYSSPSLYALIQNLKESFEMNLNGSNMACQMARSVGKNQWADNPEQVRSVECMEKNGGLSPECVGAINGPIEKFVATKTLWKKGIDAAIEKAEGFLSTDCEALKDEDQPTLLSYVLSRGPNQCKDIELAKDLYIDQTINSDEGRMSPVAPDKTFSEVMAEQTNKQKEILDQLVAESSEDLVDSEAYQEMRENGRLSLTYPQHRLLQQIKNEDPLAYEAYSKRLATLMAINEMEGVARKIETGIRQGTYNSDSGDIGKSNQELMLQQSSVLRDLVAVEREKLEAQQQEAEMIKSGYRILEQSRVN